MSDSSGGFDTSSYNQPLPVSPLDIAKQVGGIYQQKLAIDKSKLDLMSQQFGIMNNELANLIDSGADKAQAAERLNRISKTLNLPDIAKNHMMEELNAAPDVRSFALNAIRRGMTTMEKYGVQLGTNVEVENNDTKFQAVRRSPEKGGGIDTSRGTQLAIQPPPTQNTVDTRLTIPGPDGKPIPNLDRGQPGIIGASGPNAVVPSLPVAPPSAPPASASPVRAPVTVDPNYRRPAAALPAERPAAPVTAPVVPPRVSGPTGDTVQTGFNFNDRFGAAFPNRIATGLAPGTEGAIKAVSEQSGKDYATALTRGRNLQADLQPDLAVLDIVKGKAPGDFGPGTDALNQLKKLAVTWLPNVDPKIINDSSNYDVVKKYLIQGARASGNTGSDNQLAAAFEANPNTTMNTATIENIVKTRVALRKMEAAQTLMANQKGIPKEQFSEWIAKNQNQFDPRAFGFDLMDQTAKDKLYAQLKKDPKAYQKFETTLQFASDANLVGP